MGGEGEKNLAKGHYRTFRKERELPRPIPDGSWESILVYLKPHLSISPSETTGMGDSDFWIDIEMAATLKPTDAAMQFYLHNIGHRTLATFATFAFQTVRSASGKDGMDKDQKRLIQDRISARLLEIYPPRYRAKFGK